MTCEARRGERSVKSIRSVRSIKFIDPAGALFMTL